VVYRVVDGKTVVTPVQAGASDLTSTQIIEGLAVGDEIVTGPFRVLVNLKHDQAVRDEKKVKAEEEAKAAAAAAAAAAKKTDADAGAEDNDSTETPPAGDDAPATPAGAEGEPQP
jgi:hypothetical protein